MEKFLTKLLQFLRSLLENLVFSTGTDNVNIDYNRGEVQIDANFEIATGCREDKKSHCPKFGNVKRIRTKLLPPLYRFWQSRIMYNQLDTGRNDCTITAANTAWSNILNEHTPLSIRQRLKQLALQGGLDESVGRWLHKAVALIAKELKDVKTFEVRIDNEEELFAILDKGYMVITGFYGNQRFWADAQADGSLDEVHKGKEWAHAVCLCKGVNQTGEEEYWMVDNYVGHAGYNVYKMPVLKDMIKAGKFFRFGYYYVQK